MSKKLVEHPPTTLYLVDKHNNVIETYQTHGEDPAQTVEDMNATAQAATDGQACWTMSQPQHRVS